jgi:hypothetical protein
MSDISDIIFNVIPVVVLCIAISFIFTPIGIGYNPFDGPPMIVTEKYHPETVTIMNKYLSASDMKYMVMCDNNTVYSTSEIVYTNMTVNHTYIVALKTVNKTLNMNGRYWGNIEKTDLSTTLDHIVKEKI